MKLTQTRLAAACLALAAWMPLHANAGLLDDDEARRAIIDLRAKVEALARDINSKIDSKSDKAAALDMLNQHEQTMQEIAKLRGQIEVLANQVATAQKQQKDLYADLDARMRKLEPQQQTIDGRQTEVLPSEKKTYDAAMQLFTGGDYKGAAEAFQDFLKRFPSSAYAPNAQYFVGNSYYAQRNYKSAIAAQEIVVSNYRDSPKAADALLNIASNYVELNDKKSAKKTLQQLVKNYPDSSAAQTAKDRLAALK
jgi:tol-pal system protein YbgF